MSDKKERPLHCSYMASECKGDHLDIGGVEINHSIFESEAKKEDLLLSRRKHVELFQQRNEIGRVDDHV